MITIECKLNANHITICFRLLQQVRFQFLKQLCIQGHILHSSTCKHESMSTFKENTLIHSNIQINTFHFCLQYTLHVLFVTILSYVKQVKFWNYRCCIVVRKLLLCVGHLTLVCFEYCRQYCCHFMLTFLERVVLQKFSK